MLTYDVVSFEQPGPDLQWSCILQAVLAGQNVSLMYILGTAYFIICTSIL